MKQEGEDHERDHSDLFAEGTQECVLHAVREIQSVVDGHQLDAARQPWPQRVERSLDVLDDGFRIGIASRDDDAPHGGGGAPQVRDAERHVRADGHVSDVADPCLRLPVGRHRERRLLEVNLVSGAVSDRRQGGHDVAERDTSRAQLLGLSDYEKLLNRLTHRRHLRHPRDRLQGRTQEVVLDLPKGGGGPAHGRIHQGVLEDPTGAGRGGADRDAGVRGKAGAARGDAVDDLLPVAVEARRRSEDHVHVGHARHRRAANRRRAGNGAESVRQHLTHPRGDLSGRMPHPIRDESDLRIR